MIRWLVPALLLMGLLSLAACRVDDPASSATPTPADPAALGQQTFAKWCAVCHGADGQGYVNALNAPALNAGGEAYKLTDQAILDAINDGGAASGGSTGSGSMAPLGNALTGAEKTAVLEYVHSLWSANELAAHESSGAHTP